MNNCGYISFDDLAAYLRNQISPVLPGISAQLKMAPRIRRDDIINNSRKDWGVKSGVLILLYPDEKRDTYVVMIQRPDYRGVHGGQISFPGGRYEEKDDSLMDTALREAQEEVGVRPDSVEVLYMLTKLYIPPSNFLVSPFLALSEHKPRFLPDAKEVDEVLEIPLSAFISPSNIRDIPLRMADGRCMDTPCYMVRKHRIWGATAMIISELAEILEEYME